MGKRETHLYIKCTKPGTRPGTRGKHPLENPHRFTARNIKPVTGHLVSLPHPQALFPKPARTKRGDRLPVKIAARDPTCSRTKVAVGPNPLIVAGKKRRQPSREMTKARVSVMPGDLMPRTPIGSLTGAVQTGLPNLPPLTVRSTPGSDARPRGLPRLRPG
jgi:hypothetical protein